ncbi:MAG: hypothetical protein ACFB50_08470 [Rubrobacteraceae bacterium]
MSENVNDNPNQGQAAADGSESGDPQDINLTEHALLVVVVLAIALIGNFVGPDISILAAIPGMLILYVITMIGLIITKYAPFYLPSIAWISLVAILATLPWIPGSEWLVARLENVDFLALATPVLAYAGLAITRNEVSTFRQSGWKIVIVALFVFVGTYVGSAAIAHVVLTLQGQT